MIFKGDLGSVGDDILFFSMQFHVVLRNRPPGRVSNPLSCGELNIASRKFELTPFPPLLKIAGFCKWRKIKGLSAACHVESGYEQGCARRAKRRFRTPRRRLMALSDLYIDPNRLTALCRPDGIERLEIIGSFARGHRCPRDVQTGRSYRM